MENDIARPDPKNSSKKTCKKEKANRNTSSGLYYNENVYFNSSLLIPACFKISIKVPFGKSFLW